MDTYNQPSTTIGGILNHTKHVLETEASMSVEDKSQLQDIVELCNKALASNDEAFSKLLELVSVDPWCWTCIPNFNEYEASNAPELCVQHPDGVLVFQPLKY